MKKRLLSVLVLGIALALLTACSGGKEKTEAKAQAEQYQKYESHLQETFGKGDDLLSIFSSSLDGLYTGATSDGQFASILRDNVIKDSSDLVKKVEDYNVNPAFFEVNQTLATHVNTQHQLFLDAAGMANEENISKDQLRTQLMKIKEQQAQIINTWKQM